MRKVLKKALSLMCIACIAGTVLMVGCKKYAKEDDLNRLEEQKAAALAAEDERSQKQQEKADLENELLEKQQELEKVRSDKEAIKNELGG